MKRINNICLILTEDCNMRCTYCFEQNAGYKKKYMNADIITKSLDFIFKNKSEDDYEIILDLFGGEPTLNVNGINTIINYLEKIIDNIDYRIKIIITTNGFKGSLIGLEKLYRFCEKYNNILLEIVFSGILNEEMHNKTRIDINKNGTYEIFVNNLIYIIKNFKKNTFINVHSVLTPEMLKDFTLLTNNILLFKKKYGDFFNSISLVSQNSIDNDMLSIYTKEQLNYIYKDYTQRTCSELRLLNGAYDSIINSIEFLHTEQLLMCRVLKNQFSILPNGDILPCHKGLNANKYQELLMGNIMNINKLTDLHIPQKYTINIDDKNTLIRSELYQYEDCNECICNNVCHKCVVDSINLFDNSYTISKEGCQLAMTKAELTLEYERLKLIKEQNEFLKALNEKIDTLGNLNINIADAIQMLLTTNADNK